MLAHVVLVLQPLGGGGGVGVQDAGENAHPGAFLQHHAMVYGLGGVLAPGEGSMAEAQHGGNGLGINTPLPERLHNGDAGVALVVLE